MSLPITEQEKTAVAWFSRPGLGGKYALKRDAVDKTDRESVKIEMLTNLQLTKEEKESLWDQKVNMDDWDYMLIVSLDEVEIDYAYNVNPIYPLERLLNGSCDNTWYAPVNFRGRQCAIGVAYHA